MNKRRVHFFFAMHPLSPLLPYELWLQIRTIRHNDQVRDHLKTHLKFAETTKTIPYVSIIVTSNTRRVYIVRLSWIEERIHLLQDKIILVKYPIQRSYNGLWLDNNGWPIYRNTGLRMTFGDYQDNEFGVNDNVNSDDDHLDSDSQ
jgi:hypothetical protein